MITLVYGGSGSGKSEYAESLVIEYPPERKRYYIATMMAYGEEGAKRVERHRKLRSGKGFETIECPVEILKSLDSVDDPENAVILLECIPNLVANEMFDSALEEPEIGLTERVSAALKILAGSVGDIIIVTDNVFDEGTDYSAETIKYMEYLSAVNKAVSAIADRIVEVVVGIPTAVL